MSAQKVLTPTLHESILRTALETGRDPHIAMVCWIKDCTPEQVSRQERNQIKFINHALLYSPKFLLTINYPPHITQISKESSS